MDIASALMLPALASSMLLVALAGAPHCALMCGAPCAAVLGPQRSWRVALAFFVGRLLSYAAVGGLLAASVAQLGAWATVSRAAAPLWTLWHAMGLLWGLWLLRTGRQPAFVERLARSDWRPVVVHPGAPLGGSVGGRLGGATDGRPGLLTARLWTFGPTRLAGLIGMAWVAWPCGLLQSALLVASLSNSAVQGACLMALFASVTGTSLILAPRLWSFAHTPAAALVATRVAGAVLAVACLWTLAQRSGLVDACLALS